MEEYKPNSFAIADFNGDCAFRFLYIFERVPNVAVSIIIHASGLSPSNLAFDFKICVKIKEIYHSAGIFVIIKLYL